MSPFLSACSHVSALLGPADALRARTVTPDGVLPALARWGRDGGVSLTVTDGVGTLDVVLRAERLDGDAREWRSISDGTVRDAAAWLGWTLPRPTLPGLAPPAAVALAPSFAAALASVTELLGAPASVVERRPNASGRPTAAWRVRGGVLHLDGYADGALGVEATPNGERGTWSVYAPADTVAAVRDALRYLAAEGDAIVEALVARHGGHLTRPWPDAQPVGYDANGSTVDAA